MIVLCKNDLYTLEMPFLLFESLKRTSPTAEVEIIQYTQSTYKKQIKVSLSELEDYSVARNLNALQN